MDDFVRDSADSVDRWFHYISRGRWIYSPFAGIRGYLVDSAFCDGRTDSVTMRQRAQ